MDSMQAILNLNPSYVGTELILFNLVNIMIADDVGSMHRQAISTHDIDYVK